MNNNFKTFDNPYATMAQGAYPKSPRQFIIDHLPLEQRQILQSGQSIKFNFNIPVKKGGVIYPGGRYYSDNPSATDHPDWPKNGVVYLQPDFKKVKSDPSQVGGTTKQAYFAVRGSDEIIVRA